MFKPFRSLLIALALGVAASAASALQEIPIASVSRITTATSADMFARKNDFGITAHFSVTAVTGTATITPIIEGKSPQGAYYTVLQGTAVTATGVQTMYIGPGLPATSNVSANTLMPQVFRVRVLQSGATGTNTFSLGISRTTHGPDK